jgi:hypothetical protein
MTKTRTRHAPDGRAVESSLEGLTLHVVKDFGRVGVSDVQEVKRRLRLLSRAVDPETALTKMEADARRVLRRKGVEPATLESASDLAARLEKEPHTPEHLAGVILASIHETQSAIVGKDARTAARHAMSATSFWWLAFFKAALEHDILRERNRAHNLRLAVSRAKHIPAVQAAVTTILERNPKLSARRVFDELPDGDCGRGIDVQINGVRWNVYRDAGEVVAHDCSTGRERALKRETSDRPWRVIERYVRRDRENRSPQ